MTDRIIHRYTVPISQERQGVRVSANPVPLHVAASRSAELSETVIDLWCEVDDTPDAQNIEVCTLATGYSTVPEGLDFTDHIGSVLTPAGLVWHVYVRVSQ